MRWIHWQNIGVNKLKISMDYSFFTLISLAFFAFIAGFIDAVVGGGGLIQLPALLINFPSTPLPTLFGTTKIAGFSGTSIAAIQYSKKVKFDFRFLMYLAIISMSAAYIGAKVVYLINVNTLKPLILFILIIIAIYTFIKKDFGQFQTKQLSVVKSYFLGGLMAIFIGFYDGFFGPGTGSFLVLGFVVLLGFEFIKASAYAKVVNCMTNIGALSVFIVNGNFILVVSIVMAISNVLGSYWGSKMAIKKGNGFIRIFFFIIVCVMILRYGYDIYFKS